ncbi:hypothetical protein JZ751_000839, partial [Albula glossodonta]
DFVPVSTNNGSLHKLLHSIRDEDLLLHVEGACLSLQTLLVRLAQMKEESRNFHRLMIQPIERKRERDSTMLEKKDERLFEESS